MALQTTGPITLSDISGEFGGSTPHSLSEYYGVASGVPTTGALDFSDYYGKSAQAADLFATYAGSITDSYSSAGITWKMRNRLTGSTGTPTVGGYVSLTGTGTFPCVYGGTSGAADAFILEFAERDYVALSSQFAATHSGAIWTKLQLSADNNRTDYMIYAFGIPYASSVPMQDYRAAIDGGSLSGKINWYS